ncbi:MAG: TonB family protein [Elusimicrobia bacterium]|nr:TonB family protein [Elusimicrobiota bacterium]
MKLRISDPPGAEASSKNGNVRPYLGYSAAAHAGLMAALWLLTHNGVRNSDPIYKIDFIGPAPGIVNRSLDSEAGRAPGEAAPGKIAPQEQRDEFSTRSRRPLPRPSILRHLLKKPAEPKAPSVAPARSGNIKEGASAKAGPGEGGADTAVSSDMPDFPYPWYISQVRASLWNQWASRMPEGSEEAVVMFSILRNGQMVDLRIESSSGDGEFDYVALGAAQDAAPLPPLPPGFREPFLKIHVRFRSQ